MEEEKNTNEEIEEIIEPVPEEVEKVEELIEVLEKRDREKEKREEARQKISSWAPKTSLGRKVKEGKEKDLDKILASDKKILEPEIIDSLINIETDLLLIGQAKGKFGGGKRRAWRQTQKKTMEGNIITFSSMAVVGDKNSHVGIGYGKAKETLPAREKAIRNAKLNIVKIVLGREDPHDANPERHTLPFAVEGKCGSVRIKLMPAPRGTGLVAGDELKKILRLAGIKDVYSRTFGKTRTTFNLAKAVIDALKKTTTMEL